jgi:hypothetical protein
VVIRHFNCNTAPGKDCPAITSISDKKRSAEDMWAISIADNLESIGKKKPAVESAKLKFK